VIPKYTKVTDYYHSTLLAADMLFHDGDYSQYYTQDDKLAFIKMMNDKLVKIDGDRQLLQTLFLKIYANPVKNYFSVINSLLNVKNKEQ